MLGLFILTLSDFIPETVEAELSVEVNQSNVVRRLDAVCCESAIFQLLSKKTRVQATVTGAHPSQNHMPCKALEAATSSTHSAF